MCAGIGKFGRAASCAMTDVMVVARIAQGCATNDHRRAFKFSLILWFFLIKKKEHKNKLYYSYFLLHCSKESNKEKARQIRTSTRSAIMQDF